MTQTARIVTRVGGWGVVVIGFLITFIPQYATTGSVWTYSWIAPITAEREGAWTYSAVSLNAGVLVAAAIVAVVGIVAVILSYKIPEKA